MRSKTLGSDKAIGSRPVVVRSVCFIREEDWLKEGWALLSEAANFKRDYLLPVPTSSLQGCLQAELLYSAGFAILNRLLCSLHFPSAQLLVIAAGTFLDASFGTFIYAFLYFYSGLREITGEHAEGCFEGDPFTRVSRHIETALAFDEYTKALQISEEDRSKTLDVLQSLQHHSEPREEREFQQEPDLSEALLETPMMDEHIDETFWTSEETKRKTGLDSHRKTWRRPRLNRSIIRESLTPVYYVCLSERCTNSDCATHSQKSTTFNTSSQGRRFHQSLHTTQSANSVHARTSSKLEGLTATQS